MTIKELKSLAKENKQYIKLTKQQGQSITDNKKTA